MEDPNTGESKKPPEKEYHRTMALKGISIFLEAYPLQPPHVPNIPTNVDQIKKLAL
jgi:hypothetical protein